MNTDKQKGITLIELVLTLGVIGLLFNISLPSFKYLIDKNEMAAEISQMRGTLQLARKTAINLSKKVTLCPTANGKQCGKDWSKGYMAFVDENQDRQYTEADELLYEHQIQDEKISLRWRAFGRSTSLQWHETGITNHQNGSFEYCYQDQPKLARAIFITKAGRMRISKDNNGDNIHDNAAGNNISC